LPSKKTILQGYEDGSYSATLKKRHEDWATFLYAISNNSLPIFGPPCKKLRQSTLTQSFNNFPGEDKVDVRPTKEVIDLTDKQPPIVTDRKPRH
jgi:hypothetical protein